MKREVFTLLTKAGLVVGMISRASLYGIGAPGQAHFPAHKPPAARRVALRAVWNAGDSIPAPGTAPAATVSTRYAGVDPILPNRPALVSNIYVNSGREGETIIDVPTSRPITYRVRRLKDPARLVVDLDEALFNGHRRVYPGRSDVLKDVRVAQFQATGPAVVRVVADLAGSPRFDVHAQPGGVRIELRSRKPAKKDTGFHAIAVAQSEYQNALPIPAGSHDVTAAPRIAPPAATPESLRAGRAARILRGTSEADLAAAQNQSPATAQAPVPAPQDQTQNTQNPSQPQPTQNQSQPQNPPPPAVPPAAPPPGPTAPAPQTTVITPERPQYTGEPISLNLKDVDLKDFFRLIHEISGLNIIIDPNVSGSVTLVLDSVPWDQALDIVLKNNHLDKILEGNVLRIARIETLAAEQENIKKLAEAREEAQPLVTVFRPVNYAKANTIATMLKSWAGGGALTKRGNVLVDDRSNTLIISDIQTQIPVIEAIITKLDKKAKQISIEARVVLATASFSRSLQAALSGAYSNRSLTTVVGGSTGTGASATSNIVPPPRVTIGQTSAGGFGAFAISNQSARYILNAAIAAAETKSQARTISRPTIITQNNIAGTVQQGSQIPIQTTINNTISIQYISATLQLTVTPQVTEDGNVFLVINVQNASPGPALTTAGPSINTQSAQTQVLVPDGGTVVFGGVTVGSRTKSATYVPLLGSIPILGHLFKTSNVQDSDNELLFFVSPKILAG